MEKTTGWDNGALDDAVVLAPPQVIHAEVLSEHLWMANREGASLADERVEATHVYVADLLARAALVVHIGGDGAATIER